MRSMNKYTWNSMKVTYGNCTLNDSEQHMNNKVLFCIMAD